MSANNNSAPDADMPPGVPDTVPVLLVCLVCAVTVCLCCLALVKAVRGYTSLSYVSIAVVSHALVLHALVALFVIVGLATLAAQAPVTVTDECYIWLNTLNFQEHVAHLLIAVSNVSRLVKIDHAVLFIVLSWMLASTPSVMLVRPHFNRYAVGCNWRLNLSAGFTPSLWNSSPSEINKLAILIPVVVVSSVTCGLTLYGELYKKRWGKERLPTSCAKAQRRAESEKLALRLTLLFLMTTFPTVVQMGLAHRAMRWGKWDWVWLSVQGMSGGVSGMTTLVSTSTPVRSHPDPHAAHPTRPAPSATFPPPALLSQGGEGGSKSKMQEEKGATSREAPCTCQHCIMDTHKSVPFGSDSGGPCGCT